MLARVQLGYDMRKELKLLTQDQYNELKSIWGLQLPPWENDPSKPHAAENCYSYGSEVLVETGELALLRKAGITHVVKEVKGTYATEGKDQNGNTYITKLVLPGLGLLEIDEVTWMEDACTEDLQKNLEEGWRIIAVCPPNGTRRPTYIIGRSRAKSEARGASF